MRKKIDLKIAYRLINHGPLVVVSSLYNEKVALTPIAWHMPISDDPPLIGLAIWEGHFVYKAIAQTGDFVVNIPSRDMAEMVRKLGSVSGHKVDKCKKYGARVERSKEVRSPRLDSAIAVLECRVRKDPRLSETYNIVLGDVVYAEAERAAFTTRWLPEKGRFKTLHHLGDKIFCVPDKRVLR